jgi:protein TonB
MPKSMFQDVVCPRRDSTRKWYALPMSFIVHTSLVIVLVVIPLMATDVLPAPRVMSAFVNAPEAAVPPPPPVAPRQEAVRAVNSVDSAAAPVEAPPDIRPEPSLAPEPEQSVFGVPGVIVGLGGASIEAPPPLPQPAVVKPVRPGGDITAPRRIKDVAPVYPAIAQSARVQGDVILEATIGLNGKVEDARVLRSVPLLDQAAVTAVRGWEYTPTLLNGQPVPIIMTVTVRFRLQ